jgi:glyoxylase-like metal-dependent hydrolase (beta-lactamase superfamily II)
MLFMEGSVEFQDFYKKHKGLAATVYDILSRDANVFFRVKENFKDVHNILLSRLRLPNDMEIRIEDVIFIIDNLPFSEKRINRLDGHFELKLPYVGKKSSSTLEAAFNRVDEEVLKTVWDRSFSRNTRNKSGTQSIIDTISKEIEAKDQALEKLVTAPSESFRPPQDTTFRVARLWNSWTPSFFDIPGGCYVILPPEGSRELKVESQVVVIDPGFGFLKVLRENWGIGIPEIDTVVVSHFHPDHVGGLFEYIALQHTYYKHMKRQAILYLNPTCKEVFGDLSPAIEARTIDENDEIAIIHNFQRYDGLREYITLKPFKTYHWELGHENKSLGFLVSIETRVEGTSRFVSSDYPNYRQIAILGDTAYSPKLAKKVYSADVLVFHLGSFKAKESEGAGKHLYARGLIDLMKACRTYIKESSHQQRRIVLISELGLEHSSWSDIKKYVNPITLPNLPSQVDDDRDYVELISEILREEARDWAEVFIVSRLDIRVVFGQSIQVWSGDNQLF